MCAAVLSAAVLAACSNSRSGDDTASPGVPVAVRPTTPAPDDRTEARATGLLPPVQAYVDAVGNRDLDGLVRAFTSGAEIVDVGRSIRGQAAISRWAEAEVIGGTLTVSAVTENRDGYQRLLVRFTPRGRGGFAAHYAFTVNGDAITRAELTYA
ncbi:nuclear transport factor 2 family protein [Streptomyces flaveolus]|uniref:nuclear transport factor 2 family protein n=1 Tax=Streptomyces flaveolus TaxID=67297 RepID=UPI0033C1A329